MEEEGFTQKFRLTRSDLQKILPDSRKAERG